MGVSAGGLDRLDRLPRENRATWCDYCRRWCFDARHSCESPAWTGIHGRRVPVEIAGHIRDQYGRGWSMRSLAKRFRIGRDTVSRVVHRQGAYADDPVEEESV